MPLFSFFLLVFDSPMHYPNSLLPTLDFLTTHAQWRDLHWCLPDRNSNRGLPKAGRRTTKSYAAPSVLLGFLVLGDVASGGCCREQ
jgi:hypothetical protein